MSDGRSRSYEELLRLLVQLKNWGFWQGSQQRCFTAKHAGRCTIRIIAEFGPRSSDQLSWVVLWVLNGTSRSPCSAVLQPLAQQDMPCPSLSAAGLAGELPVRLLPEPALRSRCGRGIFRVGCGFPYPVVSIALQRPKEKEHLLDTEQATGYFYKRPLARVLKERAAGAWGSAGVLPAPGMCKQEWQALIYCLHSHSCARVTMCTSQGRGVSGGIYLNKKSCLHSSQQKILPVRRKSPVYVQSHIIFNRWNPFINTSQTGISSAASQPRSGPKARLAASPSTHLKALQPRARSFTWGMRLSQGLALFCQHPLGLHRAES